MEGIERVPRVLGNWEWWDPKVVEKLGGFEEGLRNGGSQK
jgi:hypothetical protein